ncbi:MAG: family 2 glycosyl transferase [Kangiellaceae bacterium]|nr:family 2 glycosyl transferase [Kangiellaceae bacterium]|tara:strand:+ start:30530 stop:33403 length:2874 start_codon:yes stop_codon:yes gene_type:complete
MADDSKELKMAAMENELSQYKQRLIDKDRQIIQLSSELHKIKHSRLWKLAAGMQKRVNTVRDARSESQSLRLQILPYQQVTLIKSNGHEAGWEALGHLPVLALVPFEKVSPGNCWFVLEFDSDSARDKLTRFLYFDLGDELDEQLGVQLPSAVDSQRYLIYWPKACRGLFLALSVAGEVQFQCANARLRKVDTPENIPPWLGSVYKRLQKVNYSAYELVAANQLEVSNAEPGGWQSTGDDPYFYLRGEMPSSGWLLLSFQLQLASHNVDDIAKLYFDVGEGFNEADSVTISITEDSRYEVCVHQDASPKAIRFDPCQSENTFQLTRVRIRNVEEFDATQAMRTLLRSVDGFDSDSELDKQIQKHARLYELGKDDALVALYRNYLARGDKASNYKKWMEQVEQPWVDKLRAIYASENGNHYTPKISIVLPVYNTQPELLARCINSVIHQYYPNWQLCIADDHSDDKRIIELLKEYEQSDSRIQVIYRAQNGHISAASNSALDIATGEYIALLDHDDELALHALLAVVDALNDNPEAQIIYSDEDKIDEVGTRFDPHFKAGWCPALIYSQNYISHLGVYSSELVERVGGFRQGYEGSQDYDLLLRCVAEIENEQVVHIPWVLYHWRVTAGSTAAQISEKSYANSAGIKALTEHVRLIDKEAIVEQGPVPTTYRVRWGLPTPLPLVSILIPTRDGYEVLSKAVNSILEKTTYANFEILILDNQSRCKKTLKYLRALSKEPRVRIIKYDYPFNFSAINNYGAKQAQGELLALVNNDVEVISPDWLSEMVSHACRREVGCVGAKLYYSDGRIQHAGVVLGIGKVAGHSHKFFPKNAPGYFMRLRLVQNYSAVTGAALVVRKSVYEEVGGLNETSLTVAFNDVDFCLRVRERGYQNIWTPYAELFHHESVSRGAEDSPEKLQRFNREVDYMLECWGDKLIHDPCYSPHLTREHENFELSGIAK